jgi:RNA polymerase sigma factor (sigma-70 family)
MNREEVKNMLEEYWYDNQYLKEKTKEVEKITAMMIKNPNLEIYQVSKKQEEEILFKLLAKKKRIDDLIERLSQPYRIIMYLKYITFLTFDQIADQMNYSTKRIYQLHSEGVNKLQELINNENSI